MTNFQVYKKTLSFSLLMFAFDILALLAVIGLGAAGFFILIGFGPEAAMIGLIVGLILGIAAATLIGVFLTNRVKAAQIAMMVKGVTEDQLPDHTFKAGLEEVKGRFGKITLFFFITNSIKSIFRQIGRGITRIGNAVGGEVGGTVTSTIDSAIQTVIGYLCDCCLGWVLFRKDENSAKAACEGCVIFFKHGKTLIRNVGRIFGFGILSFLLIGGAFTGLFFLLFYSLPEILGSLSQAIIDAAGADAPEWLSNPTILYLVVAFLIAVALWSILHSVLVRPFILVGVLRNYMAAGKEHLPSEADFKELDKYPGFRKLRSKM